MSKQDEQLEIMKNHQPIIPVGILTLKNQEIEARNETDICGVPSRYIAASHPVSDQMFSARENHARRRSGSTPIRFFCSFTRNLEPSPTNPQNLVQATVWMLEEIMSKKDMNICLSSLRVPFQKVQVLRLQPGKKRQQALPKVIQNFP